ncbi:MAG: hypothetical protein WC528_01920 [Patescibacteria group bacterium]
MKKSEVQIATKTNLQTRLSLGFMLATCFLTVGVIVFAGAYTLIMNNSAKTDSLNVNQPSNLSNLNRQLNNNAATNQTDPLNANAGNNDLEFNTGL